MSKDIIVSWSRSGVSQYSNPIPLRLDNMNWREAADMGGAAPYDSYWAFTQGGLILQGIRRGDLLTDVKEIDSITNALARYRIFGNPETNDTSDQEIAIEKVMGT